MDSTLKHIFYDLSFNSFFIDREKDFDRRDLSHALIKLADPRLQRELIDVFRYQRFLNSPDYGKQVVIISSPLVGVDIDPNLVELTNNSFYGMWYMPFPINDVPVKRQFNCFINRTDAFRQGWFYALQRRNMIDDGYVSCNMNLNRIPYLQGLTDVEAFDHHYREHFTVFEAEHAVLRKQVPFKNFIETNNIADQIMQSRVGICLETYFDDDHVISFSEKIFRCLQLPRPWLLFSVQGAVQYLRDMGFDVLDDVVDHRYDTIENPIDRQVEILAVCKKMYDLNTENIFPRLATAAKHNQLILSKWYESWGEDLIITIANAKKKLDKLNT